MNRENNETTHVEYIETESSNSRIKTILNRSVDPFNALEFNGEKNPMNKSTRENSFKEGVHIGLKHTRTRTKYYLVKGPYRNSKYRCSGCNNPVMILKGDRGNHLSIEERYVRPALYCNHCKVIFPKYAIIISKVGQYAGAKEG
jgi:hypothetical protein